MSVCFVTNEGKYDNIITLLVNKSHLRLYIIANIRNNLQNQTKLSTKITPAIPCKLLNKDFKTARMALGYLYNALEFNLN